MAGWTVPGYTRIRILGAGEVAGAVAGDARLIVEAVHDASGARVVITYPGPKLCADEAFRDRLWQDAELLAELDVPNVVRVRGVVASETGTELALVTEAVDGAALRRVLAISGPLSPEAALAVLRGSLLGLGAATEAGVAHRDFQPSNVVITPEGIVKVGGFGLAVRTEAMMPAAGTSAYMAPELWEGAAPGLATDIYAATATFFECLVGRAPYAAKSVFKLQTLHRAAPIPVGDVPEALAPLLTLGLAKAPEERPATAAAFLAEVDAAAVVAFGLEWEERGRRELAALVAALPADDGGGAGGVGGAGAAGSAATAGTAGSAMGRRTRAGIAAAVVAVIGASVAAVALSPGKHSEAAVGPPGETVSAGSGQDSPADGGSSAGAAGVAPTPGASSAGSTSSAATGGSTTSTTGTSPGSAQATTATAISVTLPTVTSLTSPPNYTIPPSQLPTTRPTGPGGSTAPPSSSSPAVTVSASASMAQGMYSGPCPPAELPTATLTFSVSGLPSGTVAITYRWRVTGEGGSSGGGGGGDVATGSGLVNAHNGSTAQSFPVSDDQHPQKDLSGTVEITWTAPGTPGGTTDAGPPVDIKCVPSGGSSSAPTSGG